ncbi:Dabb family protein [Parapedobacter pyrenivorans]|uniref:Dabb family protein n=1 Tax=Parapedobacter pyrenivorans TaxID=1305674 RepID=UPI00333E9DD6
MVRHFGVFKFKDNISESHIAECFQTMQDMVGQIPGLLSMEHGTYSSPEGMNDGFTHGFVMTFDNERSRDEYLPHPVHERAKDIVVPCLDRVVVFDFAVKD